MCAGSVAAGIETKAREGQALMVADFGVMGHRHRLFAPVANPTCPVCIDFNSTVMFATLPAHFRETNQITLPAKAVMISPDVNFHQSRNDVFVFENGARIQLSQLPVGTNLKVVEADVVFAQRVIAAANAKASRTATPTPQSVRERSDELVPVHVG